MRRIISILLAMVLMIGMLPFVALQSQADSRYDAQPASLSQGVQNIVKRARQMTQIQWTPKKDIKGWGGGVTYKAGTTYVGLPYGQPVDADYVPWETSLEGFLNAVNDPNSKMYTSKATYNKDAPYFSIDCSAFVSWAWGLSNRHTTATMHQAATKISESSYAEMEVGDCLCKSEYHTVLVTDMKRNSSGTITAVEISEATTGSTNYLCHSMWFGEGYGKSMDHFQSTYLDSGYILYRSKTRDSVTYTHSCAVPLEGDSCSKCHDHSFTEVVTQTPTCTQDGLKKYTCSCGYSYEETITAIGHQYDTVVTAPTCEESGYTTYVCVVCNHTEQKDSTDPLGHDYADGSCTRCGEMDPSVQKGDLNGDGTVSSADAVMLSRHLVGLAELTEGQLAAADVNGDGSVSSADAVMIARYLVGLVETI